jgi:hypothetical protein
MELWKTAVVVLLAFDLLIIWAACRTSAKCEPPQTNPDEWLIDQLQQMDGGAGAGSQRPGNRKRHRQDRVQLRAGDRPGVGGDSKEGEMRKVYPMLRVVTIFLAGMTVSLNLAELVPHGQYSAAWWKVGVAVFMAVAFSAEILEAK